MKKRLVVMGWDGVPPELLFDKFLDELPTVKFLVSQGIHGRLRTCDPPITVPAWSVMMTGRTPAELNVFGFRERKNSSYTDISLVNSASIKAPFVWDYIGAQGGRSCVFGFPPGYPPRPIQGALVSCHLTPGPASRYTFPDSLQEELEAEAGPYIPDVPFRTDKREEVLDQLMDMTHQHGKIRRQLFKKEKWDFFMQVEIGTDRMHHAFWKFTDPAHPKYVKDSKFSQALLDYYRLIDSELHELLSMLHENTCLLLLSDHGAKAMQGAFCLNEWLIEHGYLVLKSKPDRVMRLEEAQVDWPKTRAWGWGGYYARLFLNVKGREPEGLITAHEIDQVRTELLEELKTVQRPDGQPLEITVINPNGSKGASDLMLYFGDLSYRSAGTIGHGRIFLDENDTGPDDAVHSRHGIFLFYDPKSRGGITLSNSLDLTNIAPSILHLLNIGIPAEIPGKPFFDDPTWHSLNPGGRK